MPLPPVTRVEAQRLKLRPLAAADLPDLLEVNGDPEVTRFLPYETWQSLADAEAWLARMETMAASGTGQVLVLELGPTPRSSASCSSTTKAAVDRAGTFSAGCTGAGLIRERHHGGVRLRHPRGGFADRLMRRIRFVDKLVDELAKGKTMERILRTTRVGESATQERRTP